jgi:hypothetical protein
MVKAVWGFGGGIDAVKRIMFGGFMNDILLLLWRIIKWA